MSGHMSKPIWMK